jgi:chromosomal replication initiator protein
MKTPWFHIICEMDGDPPTIRDIQRAVCGRFAGVTVNDILSHRRGSETIMPRHIAIYLAKMLTLKSLPTIGVAFSGRDHSTIIHAIRKIERLSQEDDGLKRLLTSIGDELGCAA